MNSINKVLVIGASGFVGRHVAKALLAEGNAVRCLARDLDRVQDLAIAGCEVVQGDISDLASMQRAMESVQAVYIAIHMLSPQQTSASHQRFMDVEKDGLRNVMTACRTHGARRLIYVTSLGIAPDAPSEWLRERWQTEQMLLNSDLDVTVIQPGQIVGIGGRGFDMIVSQSKRAVAVTIGSGRQKMRTIAIDDLVYYLVGVLNDPRAYQQCYDVGSDDVLTVPQMIDITAEILGRPHPIKIRIPGSFLSALAPVIERMSKLPKGALKGFLDSLTADMIGAPMPIGAILPRMPLSYRQAVQRTLAVN